MKKNNISFLRLLICTLLLCLILPSCGAPKVADGTFATTDPNRIELTDAEDNLYDYDLKTVPYAYADMLTMGNGAIVCDAGEKVLFVAHINSFSTLFTFDKRTGEVTTFCKDAACNHREEACSAFGISGLELHNGKIYGNGGGIIHTVMELRGDRFESILKPVDYFRHYENDMYVTAVDGTLLRYANGSTKNPEIVMEDSPHYFHTFIDGYFYYCTTDFTIVRFPLNDPSKVEKLVDAVQQFRTDGEYLYYPDESFLLRRCNLDGSNNVQLTDMPIYAPSVSFDAEYMYFMGNDPTDDTAAVRNQLFRMKRGTQEAPELIVDTGIRVIYIYPIYATDYLFLTASSGMHVINKDGTGLQKLTLE